MSTISVCVLPVFELALFVRRTLGLALFVTRSWFGPIGWTR
jgi:hypothetical protein